MTNKSKAVGEPVWQVWDGDTCSWHDVTPEYYAERLPSNRRILYTAAPTPSASKCVTGEYADCGNDFGCAGCVEPSSAQPPIDSAKVEDTGEPDQEGFERFAERQRYDVKRVGKNLSTTSGIFPATYYRDLTEHAWRGWANRPVAAPAPSAGSVPVAISDVQRGLLWKAHSHLLQAGLKDEAATLANTLLASLPPIERCAS